MHRFFIDSSAEGCDEITITGDDVVHITRVLRLGEGDEITVCDSLGYDCLCKLVRTCKDEVTAKVQSRQKNNAEANINITVYQGVPKGDKLDTVVQKCVELGAVRIVPVAMKRCVALIKDPAKKTQRLQKIAHEAAKQCGRARLPAVDCVMNFADALSEAANADLRLLAYEDEKMSSIKSVLRQSHDVKNISIFIGPEGGFDPLEVKDAQSKGFSIVSMGPRILRTETAPLAAITAVMYELGDW
ncbi:MAG: 16S rRNA (uracil(1498)-N(3))-methyltransferase [Clostridia bacterium]|nr:16S rRNA (uracil(1498)-N(3))-methyltransferase [Clostridia bacterium]